MPPGIFPFHPKPMIISGDFAASNNEELAGYVL
jgi:hypothetical protein